MGLNKQTAQAVAGHLVFWTIVGIALLVSGNATYEVLTGTLDTRQWIALAAAIVIDAAAIWMGHHTTILAKLGDSTTLARIATWFIISLSLAVNYFHGYVEASYAGGALGIIFPLLAAILFEFYIHFTIRAELRNRGEVLRAKPKYVKSRKYRDKSRIDEIESLYVSRSYDLAIAQLQDNGTSETSNGTAGTALVLDGTDYGISGTTPAHVESHLGTAETDNGIPSLAEQVDQAIVAGLTQDMTIKEIVEVLIDQGIKNHKEAQVRVSEIKPDAKPDTIRRTFNRILDSRTDGTEGGTTK